MRKWKFLKDFKVRYDGNQYYRYTEVRSILVYVERTYVGPLLIDKREIQEWEEPNSEDPVTEKELDRIARRVADWINGDVEIVD